MTLSRRCTTAIPPAVRLFVILAGALACGEEDTAGEGACYVCEGIGACRGQTTADACDDGTDTRFVPGHACESGRALSAALDEACSAPANSPSGGGGCGDRPEGTYRCDDGSAAGIEQCVDGEWTSVGTCGCAVRVGDPRKPAYAATCKHVIGRSGDVECGYAGVSCRVCRAGETCERTCDACTSMSSTNCCP